MFYRMQYPDELFSACTHTDTRAHTQTQTPTCTLSLSICLCLSRREKGRFSGNGTGRERERERERDTHTPGKGQRENERKTRTHTSIIFEHKVDNTQMSWHNEAGIRCPTGVWSITKLNLTDVIHLQVTLISSHHHQIAIQWKILILAIKLVSQR